MTQPDQAQPDPQQQIHEAQQRYYDKSEKIANLEVKIFKVVGYGFLIFLVLMFLFIFAVFY